MGVVWDEAAIEVCKAKEHLNVMLRLGSRPVDDGLYFLGVHGDARRRNNISKEFNLFYMKLTLLQLGIEAMLQKVLQNSLDMLNMLLLSV